MHNTRGENHSTRAGDTNLAIFVTDMVTIEIEECLRKCAERKYRSVSCLQRFTQICFDILDVIIPIETQIIKIRSDATLGSQMPKKRKLTVSPEIFPEKM